MYPPIFKENYKGKGAWARAGAVFNRLGRFCNNINGSGGITITPNAHGGLDISGGVVSGTIKKAFAWLETDGTTVTIGAGYMEGRFGYKAIGGGVVNVGGNESAKHLIIVTGNNTGGQIPANSVLESAFNGDTANEWRRILYRVYLRNGRPVLDMMGAGVGGIVL